MQNKIAKMMKQWIDQDKTQPERVLKNGLCLRYITGDTLGTRLLIYRKGEGISDKASKTERATIIHAIHAALAETDPSNKYHVTSSAEDSGRNAAGILCTGYRIKWEVAQHGLFVGGQDIGGQAP